LVAAGVLAACAAASGDEAMADLSGSRWRVEDIDGRGVVDDAETTLDFEAGGRVAGSGGCNRYSGNAELGAGSLAVGPLAATRMACAPALMDQEQRFFDAMARVAGWSVGADGLLRLSDAAGAEILRLAPMPSG
jgi:heat shock protein HslJ